MLSRVVNISNTTSLNGGSYPWLKFKISYLKVDWWWRVEWFYSDDTGFYFRRRFEVIFTHLKERGEQQLALCQNGQTMIYQGRKISSMANDKTARKYILYPIWGEQINTLLMSFNKFNGLPANVHIQRKMKLSVTCQVDYELKKQQKIYQFHFVA